MKIIKRTLAILGILITYEVTRYIIEHLIVRLQANDEIEQAPKDFTDSNQDDLNELYKYILDNDTAYEVEDGLF